MALTSKIAQYDESWPFLYQQEAVLLTPVFGHNLLMIEHVGSTVPRW